MNIDKLYRKYKVAIVPAIGIAFVVVLSIITINIFWQRISELRGKIATNSSQKDILDDRLKTLQGVVLEARESSTLVSLAMPSTSPAVLVLSHLNLIANDNELIMDSLTVNKRDNSQDTTGISTISINFDLRGKYANIYKFVSDISGVLPLINLDSLEIEAESTEQVLARVRLVSYYADPLTELPPLTSPLDDFTNEEKSTVSFLETFVKPSVASFEDSVPEDSKGRENPFESI